MNRYLTILLMMCALLVSAAWTKDRDKGKAEAELKRLERQLQSLRSLKTAKLDALEQAEAARWDQRYRQKAAAKQHEERTRNLESAYTRLATEISRRQDDLVRMGNETREMKMEWEDAQSRSLALQNLLTQSAEREAERLPNDIPVGISQRTLLVSAMSEKAASKNINQAELLHDFFNYRRQRLGLTMEQALSSRQSLIENEEHLVWRLQLGTVFAGELSKTDQTKTQILLRTGKLQGKVFVWRSRLAEDYNTKISQAIRAAVDKQRAVAITLDVLQNKSAGSGFTREEDRSAGAAAAIWFKKGGLVMYPLLLAAFLGMLFSLERLLVLMKKSTDPDRLMKKLLPHLESNRWQEALAICTRSKTSLSIVLESLIKQAEKSREAAEKAVRESLLRELPLLEKHMLLIAALGAAAPLMGLLGTVSGMISLFKVITDVGTNDPRILAGGISEALVTTQTGLIIAIPILLIHGYLSDRTQRIQNDITANGMRVMNTIWPEEG